MITLSERLTLPVIPDASGRVLIVFLGPMFMGLLGCVLMAVREVWRRQRPASGSDESFAMLEREFRGLILCASAIADSAGIDSLLPEEAVLHSNPGSLLCVLVSNPLASRVTSSLPGRLRCVETTR